jgi:hypothetical protein
MVQVWFNGQLVGSLKQIDPDELESRVSYGVTIGDVLYSINVTRMGRFLPREVTPSPDVADYAIVETDHYRDAIRYSWFALDLEDRMALYEALFDSPDFEPFDDTLIIPVSGDEIVAGSIVADKIAASMIAGSHAGGFVTDKFWNDEAESKPITPETLIEIMKKMEAARIPSVASEIIRSSPFIPIKIEDSEPLYKTRWPTAFNWIRSKSLIKADIA